MQKKNLPRLSYSKVMHEKCILLRTARGIGWLVVHLRKRATLKGRAGLGFFPGAGWLEK